MQKGFQKKGKEGTSIIITMVTPSSFLAGGDEFLLNALGPRGSQGFVTVKAKNFIKNSF